MTVELYEMAKPQLQTGKNASARVMWFARGSDYEPEVRAEAEARIPLIYEDTILTRQSLDVQGLGATVFHITANYGMREKPAPGGGSGDGGGDTNPGDQLGPHVQVSFGTRTQRVTQSLHTEDVGIKLKDTRPAPNHKGTIGISKTGIEGCDIVVPNLTWSETWVFNPRFVTWDYVRGTLVSTVGRVNNAKFRGFDAFEVMFMGGELHNEDNGRTPITFNFFAEKNITKTSVSPTDGFQITPEFQGVRKYGHQYLWVEYEDEVADKNPLRVPRAVFVEEVGRPGGLKDATTNFNSSNRASFTFLRIGS